MVIEPRWQKIVIDCERENINFYAREIGFFRGLREAARRAEESALVQWFGYFITYAEIELENAHERLVKLRGELADYELQHPDD